jgi:hypothetical protein
VSRWDDLNLRVGERIWFYPAGERFGLHMASVVYIGTDGTPVVEFDNGKPFVLASDPVSISTANVPDGA